MRLLVLGGTAFLGRAVARHALADGHEVTCAARGQSGEPPDDVRFVRVDRDMPAGLRPLDGERFDAVLDVSSRPSQVRAALAALAGRFGTWVYVSTCSVYADHATPDQRAGTAPLLVPAPVGDDLDEGTGGAEAYGRNNLACERAVVETVGEDRTFVCRPGLIVGPEDRTGRFEYWVRRIARGGEVLAPGRPDDAVQFIDVRDLAVWLVRAAAEGRNGLYDAACASIPRARFLTEIADGVAGEPALVWVDSEFLVAAGVEPWMGVRSLPLWLPLPEYAGFMTRDTSSALDAGLRPRPLADTARDTLAWLADQPDATGRCGLRPADEAELLLRWAEKDDGGQ